MKSEIDISQNEDLFRPPEGETGWDRLRMMFMKDMFGNSSPEMKMITSGVGMSLFIGACIGGTISSRNAVETFIRQNQATQFNTQLEAKRRLQDRLMLDMCRGAWKWGWRMALFTGSYMLFITSVGVYRNKTSVWEHIAAGVTCGTLWKAKMGLRAMAVGGLCGGSLGLFAGCLSVGVMWISGVSLAEIRYWQHNYWCEQYKKRAAIVKEKETSKHLLLKGHEERLAQETQEQKS
ncbi:RPII140-upstream gene protein-like [Limulus polyphemus]|uniref:Complex I assembly factor TIMMDC1, mitochondrial n=1 Tax=Limulus polyphemus TaxID=6850 RepID=A0ABM1BFG8_LIMPO|nr:RPII140-upstream gene protein-like [Limulus polyphemus]